MKLLAARLDLFFSINEKEKERKRKYRKMVVYMYGSRNIDILG